MLTPRMIPALLGALVVPAAVAAGCGGIPGDAVAEVDGTSIKEKDFDRLMQVAAKQNFPAGMVLDEDDDFKKCVAALGKQSKPPKGQPKPSQSQLRKQCEQQYDAMRDQVMQQLILYEWMKGEAKEQDIPDPSDAELEKEFQKAKKQSFPKDTEKQYQQYLKSSGQPPKEFEEDLRRNIEFDLLSRKIREKLIKGQDKVTDQEVQDFYTKNKANYGQPEQRDLHLVMTKTKAKASKARAELRSGASFASVAKKYSIDQATKSAGGKLQNVAKGSGQGDKTFDAQVFGARKGKLTGPIKTQYGYLVFEVDKITKAKRQQFKKIKATIRQQLISQKQNKVIEKFGKDFEKRWKDKTDCRDEFAAPPCKNAPKTNTNQQQAPPGGAVPPGGAPPGAVPPQGGQVPPQQVPPPSR